MRNFEAPKVVQFGSASVQNDEEKEDEDLFNESDDSDDSDENDDDDDNGHKEKKVEDYSRGNSANERLRHQLIATSSVPGRTGPDYFDKLMSSVFTSILQCCGSELAIIRNMNKMSFIDVDLQYIPASEKYEVETFDEDIRLYSNILHFVSKKFQRDISYIEKSINLTVENLQRNGGYAALITIVKDHEMTVDDENTLLGLKHFIQNQIGQLGRFQEAERNKISAKIMQLIEEINKLTQILTDSTVEYETIIKFLTHYENTRNEQNKMILKNKENELSQIKGTISSQIEKEIEVHNNFVSFIQIAEDDYRNSIEFWMNKYDEDFEKSEDNIRELQIDIEKQREQYDSLMKLYDEHKQEIEDYKKYKFEKQKAEEKKRMQAANKIQRWWRNILENKRLKSQLKKKGKNKKKTVNKPKKIKN